jgi:hypothetical protein
MYRFGRFCVSRIRDKSSQTMISVGRSGQRAPFRRTDQADQADRADQADDAAWRPSKASLHWVIPRQRVLLRLGDRVALNLDADPG